MAFEFPRVNLCCYWFSLRIGVYVIAFINLAFFLFLFTLEMDFAIRRFRRAGYVITEVEFLDSDMLHIVLTNEVIFSLYLFYANFKNNPSYMMPFILMKIVFVAFGLLAFIYGIFCHINGRFILEDTLLPLLLFTIGFYYIVIVYSHYRNLKEGQMTSS